MFGQRAAELAGLAASLLGWRPDEFWDATPDELAIAFGMGGQHEAVVDSTELARLRSLFPDKRDR